ncbi:MAG TPA: acetamidase/formamidase family protein [Candidatus Limnocylindrales bacterium]|nr:acetamidase/formamidase family protein [Candidatus Limnocylindrales bacterium]
MGPDFLHLGVSGISFGWDATHPPKLIVRSGSTVTVEAPDCSSGQITPASTSEAIGTIDFARIDPISGPILVEGARPGDVLQVDILDIRLGAYGWSANYPGSGLLPEDFPDPWLYIWDLTRDPAPYLAGISVPIEPMVGIVGTTPAAPGPHPAIPPTRTGGNLDIKHIGVGTTVYLPVEVEGALVGLGDPHAAQGDGEVGASGIEAPATMVVRLTARRDLTVDHPEFEVHRPLERSGSAAAGYYVTTGVGPDLYAAAKYAVRRMIDRLVRVTDLEPVAAYELCSVALDLKISEAVDHPNYVVSAFLPNDLFR